MCRTLPKWDNIAITPWGDFADQAYDEANYFGRKIRSTGA